MSDRDAVEITETEQQLIEQAQIAVTRCNWVVGECASKWTRKYSRGRTDGDFGLLVGLSADQIYQRRRVWETYGDVYTQYDHLKWSHFYVSLNWDDAPECLQWAQENEATVAEMKAWRRAQQGEDLTQDAEPVNDWGSDPAFTVISSTPTPVRDPAEFQIGTGLPSPARDPRESPETLPAFARESGPQEGEEYSPYRKEAGSPAPQESGPEMAVLEKPKLAPEHTIKRMTSTLERMNKSLTPEMLEEFRTLPEKLRVRFVQAVSELSTAVADAQL